MLKLNELLRELRGKESLRNAAERIGLSHSYLSILEKGYDKRSGNPINPTPDTLKLISKAYNYPYEKLMKVAGYIEKGSDAPYATSLSEKDERDIAKRMEKMKKDLIEGNSDGDGLSFMGEPMSEEAIESLLEALEHAERIATLANKKYTPKKYRDKK